MSQKSEFAEYLQRQVTLIVQSLRDGYDASDVYTDRGYQSGGSDPITDSDVEDLGITADDVGNTVYFFENLETMVNNGDPDIANYIATLNIMRTDL